MKETKWRLKYFKDHNGKPLYLAGMSSFGPFTTIDPEEALVFDSEDDAKHHPAWLHPTCLLDPESFEA